MTSRFFKSSEAAAANELLNLGYLWNDDLPRRRYRPTAGDERLEAGPDDHGAALRLLRAHGWTECIEALLGYVIRYETSERGYFSAFGRKRDKREDPVGPCVVEKAWTSNRHIGKTALKQLRFVVVSAGVGPSKVPASAARSSWNELRLKEPRVKGYGPAAKSFWIEDLPQIDSERAGPRKRSRAPRASAGDMLRGWKQIVDFLAEVTKKPRLDIHTLRRRLSPLGILPQGRKGRPVVMSKATIRKFAAQLTAD